MYSQQFVNGFFTTLGAVSALALVFPFYHATNVACCKLRQKRKCSYRQDCNCGCETVVPPNGCEN